MTKPDIRPAMTNDQFAASNVPAAHDLEAHMDELRRIDAVRHRSASLRTDGHKALLEFEKRNPTETTPVHTASAQADAPGASPQISHEAALHVELAGEQSKAADGAANQETSNPPDKPDNLGTRDTPESSNTCATATVATGSAPTPLSKKKFREHCRLRVEWQYAKKDKRKDVFARIEEARIAYRIKDIREDYVPVLSAAEAMRVFTATGHLAVSEQTMLSWYLVVRELFTAAKPDWVIGGARAGETGWVTAYATSRCVTAICELADVLERSENLLKYMQGIADQLAWLDCDLVPDEWRKRDAERLATELAVTLSSVENATIFDLGTIDAAKVNVMHYVFSDFKEKVKVSLGALEANFAATKDELIILRDAEESAYKGEQDARKSGPATRIFHGSATGHAFARAAILTGQAHNAQALKFLNTGCSDWMKEVADCLKASAQGVRSGAAVCKGYLSSTIDYQIAASEPTDSRTWIPGELVFALSAYVQAAGIGRDGVEAARLRHATSLVCAELSVDGTITNRMPFHSREKSQYATSTEELLGALADVVRLTHHPLDERLVNGIFHYFDRQCARNPHTDVVHGWYAEFDHFKAAPDLTSTVDAVDGLGAFNRMVDERINGTILEHFSVKQPESFKVSLDSLFYPDYGFKGAGAADMDGINRIKRESIAITMQHLRAHVLRTAEDTLYSVVLHGPGGTGKTTLIEALAKTCNVPLVEVTPSDITKAGEAFVEQRARAVFEALSMLSQVVILFDEFDPVLRRRNPTETGATTIYTFLTPGMLPKLKNLNETAGKRRVVYALMTNLVGTLDVPAIRKGRFDDAIGIFPPDPLSRAGHIARLCKAYATRTQIKDLDTAFQKDRFMDIVRRTAGVGMTSMTAKGWFRPNDDSDLSEKPIGHILNIDHDPVKIDDPEERFTGIIGSGPFAEREALQWGWLTRWETKAPIAQTVDDAMWRRWLKYLNEPPTEESPPRVAAGSRRGTRRRLR